MFLEEVSESPTTSKIETGKGWALMAKAGYKSGTGLGAKSQGRVEPIEASMQRGRLGLGHEGTKALSSNVEFGFDADAEIKSIEEYPLWLETSNKAREVIALKIDNEWIVIDTVIFLKSFLI